MAFRDHNLKLSSCLFLLVRESCTRKQKNRSYCIIIGVGIWFCQLPKIQPRESRKRHLQSSHQDKHIYQPLVNRRASSSESGWPKRITECHFKDHRMSCNRATATNCHLFSRRIRCLTWWPAETSLADHTSQSTPEDGLFLILSRAIFYP